MEMLMKTRLKTVIWLCLIVSLLLVLPGFELRMGNEQRNKTVISVIDYYEFSYTADRAHVSLDNVLRQLKEYGASTVAVREVTLGDLLYRGDIYVSTLGEFLSSAQKGRFNLQDKLRSAIEGQNINPSTTLVTTSNTNAAAFLNERLSSRFRPGELYTYKTGGKTFFCINVDTTDRLGISLGFDPRVMAGLKAGGFDILLRPRNSVGSSTAYLDEYDRAAGEYGVRYVIFDGTELPGCNVNLNPVEDLIRKYGLTTGIIEPESQDGYFPQKGLEKLIVDSGYAVNRAYIISDDVLEKLDSEDLFFRWYRSVVDRSIRFVYIRPLRNPGARSIDNIENTINAVRDLHGFISSNGFATAGLLPGLSAAIPGRLHNIIISISLLFACLLYLNYLLELRTRPAFIILVIGALASLGLNMLFELQEILVLAASIVYPTLSSLLLLKFLKFNTNRNLVVQVLMSLAIMLGINGLGAYTVVTVMPDIRFTMDIIAFHWVIPAFTAPILLHFIIYTVYFRGRRDIINSLKGLLDRRMSFLEVLLLGGLTVAFFIYIARTGNNMGVSATPLELRVREIFEKHLFVRPRFKEVLVGYPALFIMIYLYRRYKNHVIVLLFGAAAVVAGVSMVNSFCHVFTAITISVQRTVNGLVLGTAVGTIAVVILMIVLPLLEKHTGR